MRKQLNNPWVVGPLALIAVGLVAYQGLGLPAGALSAGRPALITESAEPDAAADGNAENATSALTGPEMFFAAGARDPFAARIGKVVTPEKTTESVPVGTETLKLAAIWMQGAESFVAINSRICRVGDAVAGALIESVTREGAWLRIPSGRQFIGLGQEVSFVSPPKNGSTNLVVVARER